MQTDTVQQEILLMATTTFSTRDWCEKDSPEKPSNLSQAQQLEGICWNGMIDELLPEIVEKSPSGEKLYLWQIRPSESYLQIELCNFPIEIEQLTSIDPYLFLYSKILS